MRARKETTPTATQTPMTVADAARREEVLDTRDLDRLLLDQDADETTLVIGFGVSLAPAGTPPETPN